MSTSFIYHAFKIIGYKYVNTKYKGDSLTISIRSDRRLKCPKCKATDIILNGRKIKTLRGIPIFHKDIFFTFETVRVKCKECGSITWENTGISEPWARQTKQFTRYALELLRIATIQDVANHLGVGWDTIKDIQEKYLYKKYKKPKLRDLEIIAIDEISIGHGHKYLTVVLNMKTGAIVFVGDGKGSDSLDPFWKMLGRRKNKIKAAAIDMSPAFIEAVRTNLKNAAIIFDHFHIVKLFNDKLSELRRDLYNEAKDKMEKKVLKGTRWLLLKKSDNLDDEKNEKQKLQEALDLNKPLATAYYMKEDLNQIWQQKDKDNASNFLNDYIKRANSSGIKMLIKFATTLAKHKFGILAYYDYPISTAKLEGTNNKIKTMQKQAYGFRDMEFFKLKILDIHEAKYSFVG